MFKKCYVINTHINIQSTLHVNSKSTLNYCLTFYRVMPPPPMQKKTPPPHTHTEKMAWPPRTWREKTAHIEKITL